jgi:hypothetical protein
MKKCSFLLVVAMLLAAVTPAQSQAWVRVGIGIGFPVYPYGPPCYGPYYYPYYQPYPVYVAPAPIYAAPAQSVAQPAPAPVPVVQPQQSRSQSFVETVPPPRLVNVNQSNVSRYLEQLSQQDDRVRGEAAMELGRAKAPEAIDPLCALLNNDQNSQVRETAARALGLIGNARALNALQNAALADNDRDVRHSAQYAAEVIRASLRRD